MRYETTIPGYTYWRDGDEYATAERISTITVTRRGDTIAFRLVRHNKKIRWARTFASSAKAEIAALRIARTLALAGYKLLDGEDIKLPPPDPLQSWKDACLASDGDDARLVYADILTERRDERGELIVAQAKAENADDINAALKAEQLILRHRGTFLGPFADRPNQACIQWRRGFVDTLVVERDQDESLRGFDLGAVLVSLLTHPSGELVRDLTIGVDMLLSPNTTVLDIVAMLVALSPPAVESLTLQGTWGSDVALGDVTSVLESLPRLQRFTAIGRQMALEPFGAHELVEMTLIGKIDDRSLDALTLAKLPKLERLRIVVNDPISSATAATLHQVFGSRLELDRP